MQSDAAPPAAPRHVPSKRSSQEGGAPIVALCPKLPRLDLGDHTKRLVPSFQAETSTGCCSSASHGAPGRPQRPQRASAAAGKRRPYTDGEEEEDDGLAFPCWAGGPPRAPLLAVLLTDDCGWGLFVAHPSPSWDQSCGQLHGATPTPVVFKSSDVVTEYRGNRITEERSKHLSESRNDAYVAALPPDGSGDGHVAIDGWRYEDLRRLGLPQTGLGSMANDPHGSGRVANVALHATNVVNGTKQPQRRLFLRATRDLRAGDEVLLDYRGAGGLSRLGGLGAERP